MQPIITSILTDTNTQSGSDFFNVASPEMYINMDPKKLPAFTHPDFITFGNEEKRKCKEGVNINGVFIPPNLYYHLNFHTIQLDIKDRTGKVVRPPARPYLRDNEWIIHTDYYQAQQEQKAFVIGGSRQISKTDSLVSLTCRELFLYPGAEVMGLFSIDEDKQTFNKKMMIALSDGRDLWELTRDLVPEYSWPERHPNFLIIPSIDQDFTKKEIRFGMTKKNNEIVKLSTLFTYLTQAGKKTQVGAGKSLTFFFYEEIAKEEMKGVWEAVKPAIRSEFGFRCAAFMAFTGGNVEKSQDAINLFLNPVPNGVLPFENEGRKTGKFMGGWYRSDFKYKTNLAAYLGLPEVGELGQLEIRVTDHEKANRELDQEEKDAASDSDYRTLDNVKMFYPRSLADMTRTQEESPFKKWRDGLIRHRDYLREHKPGALVDLFRTPDKKVHYTLSDARVIQNFPHTKEDNLAAPYVIYDHPRHPGSYKLHVAGLDPYNTSQTETSPSLGALYVFRRHYGALDDPFQNVMVASIAARPDSLTRDFLPGIHMLLDYYDASMLHENSNDLVLSHFDKEIQAEKYLAKTQSLQQEIAPNSKTRAVYGVPPSGPFQRAWLNRVVEYVGEVIGVDEAGKPIYGYTRILDDMLCEELIQWKKDLNTDRVDAFGHGLLYMDNLDKFEKPQIEDEEPDEQPSTYRRKPYGFHNPTSSSSSLNRKRNPFFK